MATINKDAMLIFEDDSIYDNFIKRAFTGSKDGISTQAIATKKRVEKIKSIKINGKSHQVK